MQSPSIIEEEFFQKLRHWIDVSAEYRSGSKPVHQRVQDFATASDNDTLKYNLDRIIQKSTVSIKYKEYPIPRDQYSVASCVETKRLLLQPIDEFWPTRKTIEVYDRGK